MMYTAGKPHSLLERLYASLGEHSGKQLFNEIVRAKSLKPRLTLAKLLAIPIAAIVHLLNLAVALAGLAITALGVTMIVNVWPNLAQLMFASIWTGIGLTILGAVWLARPQLLRQAHGALAREQFPTVYRMADQVAQALGSSNVDAIVIDWNFNAAFTHVGWPRKKVLHLGLPLLVVIDEREVVALLAHELAHGVNGDPNRGLFVGAAVDSLVAWADLFWRPQRWSEDLIQSILALFLLPPFVMPWLLSLILIHLLWRDQQRAEYLADYLAAQVSGTEAMISMLGKLHLHDIFTQTVLRAVRRRVPPTYNLFDDIRREFATARPIGLEETDSLAALGELRLDSTHPPTPYRVAFLKSRPAPTPKVAFSNCDLDQLRQELAPLQPYIQDSLLRAFYRAAYY